MVSMIKRLFKEKTGDDITAVILAAFLPTFAVARLYVYLAIRYNVEYAFLVIKGVHIHHLSYGIIILAVAGFLSLTTEHSKKVLAVLYGIGLAFSFDEFGMWLRLEDDYWMRQSYDAIVVICTLLFNIIFLKKFWKRCGEVLYKRLFAPFARRSLQ